MDQNDTGGGVETFRISIFDKLRNVMASCQGLPLAGRYKYTYNISCSEKETENIDTF